VLLGVLRLALLEYHVPYPFVAPFSFFSSHRLIRTFPLLLFGPDHYLIDLVAGGSLAICVFYFFLASDDSMRHLPVNSPGVRNYSSSTLASLASGSTNYATSYPLESAGGQEGEHWDIEEAGGGGGGAVHRNAAAVAPPSSPHPTSPSSADGSGSGNGGGADHVPSKTPSEAPPSRPRTPRTPGGRGA
jgi:hypothetical protein